MPNQGLSSLLTGVLFSLLLFILTGTRATAILDLPDEQNELGEEVSSLAHGALTNQHQRRFLAGSRSDNSLEEVYVEALRGGNGLDLRGFSKDKNYLIAQGGEGYNELSIINITEVARPEIVCNVMVGDSKREEIDGFWLSPDEDILAVGFQANVKLFSFSFANATIEFLGRADRSWLHGDVAYYLRFSSDGNTLYHKMEDTSRLARIDISDRSNPKYLNHTEKLLEDFPIYTYALTSQDLFLATVEYKGLLISKVDSYGRAKQLSFLASGYNNRFILPLKDGKTVLLTDSISGFVIVDISDFSNPFVRGTIVTQQYFWENQLRPMAISDDEKTAYLNTYDNFMLIVSLENLDHPRIESVISVSRRFTIIQDFQWAVEVQQSTYRLFDISKIFLHREEVVPQLAEDFKPISLENVHFDKALNFYQNSFHFFQDLRLMIYIQKPNRYAQSFLFYDTTESVREPRLLGSFLPPIPDPEYVPYVKFEMNKARSRLYVAIFYEKVFRQVFCIANTTDFAAVAFIDCAPFAILHDVIEDNTLTNLVLTADENTVIFGMEEDSLLAFDVSSDKANLQVNLKQIPEHKDYNQMKLYYRDDKEYLMILSTFAFSIFEVEQQPLDLRLVSSISLEESGGNFTIRGEEVLVAAGSRGILAINISDLSLPAPPKVFFPAFRFIIKNFIILPSENELVFFGEKEIAIVRTTPDGSYKELGSIVDELIFHVSQLYGSFGFIGLFYGSDQAATAKIGTFSMPNILFIDKGDSARLELGDDFKTLQLYPLREREEESAFGVNTIYGDIWEDHKFISIRQFVKFQSGIVSNPFPKWITPDPGNSLMLLELNTPEALGTHFVVCKLSFMVPDEAFIGLPGIPDGVASKRLKQSLIQLGYLDNKSFNSGIDEGQKLEIPEEFSPSEGLVEKKKLLEITGQDLVDLLSDLHILRFANATHHFLNPDYSQSTLILSIRYTGYSQEKQKQAIDYLQGIRDKMLEPNVRQLLQTYYQEVVGEFTVYSSLNVTLGAPITIFTKSSDLVTVTLQFIGDGLCGQFSEIPSAVISANKTKLQMSGNYLDVNEVLDQVRIHVLQPECEGKILVDDQLNPVFAQSIHCMQDHFTLNQPPTFASSVYSQFSQKYKGGDLKYDTYFDFHPKVLNEVDQKLTFKVEVRGANGWELADSLDWLQFDKDTGIISGSPSKDIVFKSFEIRMTVFDEFSSSADEFSVFIQPTASYLIEMAIQIGSFLAVAFGCWKYKDELHLIFCKSKYRFPRDERAFSGQPFLLEIPIVRRELEDENPVIKFMKEKSMKRMKERPSGRRNNSFRRHLWIEAYFDSQGMFHANEFVEDLKELESDDISNQVQSEALKQLGLLVCYHIYDCSSREVESRVLSIFCTHLPDEPLWGLLKDILQSLMQQIGSGQMHLPMVIHSERLKTVHGFKLRSMAQNFLGKLTFQGLKLLNMHVIQLPLPTCLPVWLKCEMDANYIILSGTPRPENSFEFTRIRIIDTGDFVLREFDIEVHDRPATEMELEQPQSEAPDYDSHKSFSRSFSMNFMKIRSTRAWNSRKHSTDS